MARQLSVRAIMETILRRGPTSRAELAKHTGLSRQTTTQVVLELEREGWLQVSGRAQGPIGRSAPTYDLDPQAAYVLGIQLEGSVLRMALADIRGRVVIELDEPTDPKGGMAVVAQVGRVFAALIGQSGVSRERVQQASMGSPGVVDPKTGHIDIAPSIPHLGEINVVDAMRHELDLPLTIENGVKLAALGELWQGAARGADNFVYFGIGSGVGMGIVAEGRLLRGTRGAAGEVAFLPTGGDAFSPSADGAFEAAVNSAAMVRRFEAYGGKPGLTIAEIFVSLHEGDAHAIAAIDETSRILVLAIAAARAIIDPQLIVLGGSVGRRPEMVDRIRALMHRASMNGLTVAPSLLAGRATLVGALGEALDRLHTSLFGVDAARPEISLTNLTGGSPVSD
ncbi:MAG: ROK family transcriptional regulator [Devosia sp.]